jgi:hypothetical protein
MSVEGSDDLDAAFASVLLLNLELLLVVEDTFESDWFERPLAFKLV